MLVLTDAHEHVWVWVESRNAFWCSGCKTWDAAQ